MCLQKDKILCKNSEKGMSIYIFIHYYTPNDMFALLRLQLHGMNRVTQLIRRQNSGLIFS